MMNKGTLYTSYFANWRNWKKLNNTFNVAVTRFKPKYMDFKREGIELIQPLSPPKELLLAYKNNKVTEKDFEKQFRKYIISNEESIKSIDEICRCLDNGTNVLMLCFEKKDMFCHRHILSQIFNKIGYKTKEV